MIFDVTCRNGAKLRVDAPDPDVAIFRAQRAGFPAVAASCWPGRKDRRVAVVPAHIEAVLRNTIST